MEIIFPALERETQEENKETETLFSSCQIQRLLQGLTPEEVAIVRLFGTTYLSILETIAFVRRHHKNP